ncbi:hypothetical protein BDF14DRAFT_1789336 [Spinellus fusiger]|nr:hypothetical protein BDF14DRAFT_1789336 [Spinellus fusiger]
MMSSNVNACMHCFYASILGCCLWFLGNSKSIVLYLPEFTFIPADPQSSSTATDTATATATASTSASASASASATTNASSSSSSVAVIQSENIQYRVVKLKADNLNHEAAANACKKEALGSITSTQYTDLSKQLLKDGYSKVIINKWNGDNYGIGGENCLVLIADTGVFPDQCKNVSHVLCQQ